MADKKAERNAKPEPEVKPRRRRFSAEEKLRILAEADACTERGEIGALVRREGIHSSYLSRWRRARDRGELDGLRAQKRGPQTDPEAEANEKLRRENERLRVRLQQAETIIEVQKKLSEMLGLEMPTAESIEPA